MPRGIPADLVGKRYGTWTVLARSTAYTPGRVTWVCQCDCGSMGAIPTGNLASGASRGCRNCGGHKGAQTKAERRK